MRVRHAYRVSTLDLTETLSCNYVPGRHAAWLAASSQVRLALTVLLGRRIDSERMKVEALRRHVPLTPQFDHLLRYEASLERTLDGTLSQLERVQRMWLGQAVLPKLEVHHSVS